MFGNFKLEIKTELPKNYWIAFTFAMDYTRRLKHQVNTHKFYFFQNCICIRKLAWNFGMDKSSQKHLAMGTFRLRGHSCTWTFCLCGHFGLKTFRHRDFLAWGSFGIGTFCHFLMWVFKILVLTLLEETVTTYLIS